MEKLCDIMDAGIGPVPEWFTMGDMVFVCFACAALAFVLGHWLGKRGI
jgi:hypothetical protein